MTSERYLDPRHGPHEPTNDTPKRRPLSIRRTSSVDSQRPSELDRRLRLHGRARNLITRADGSTETAGSAEMLVEIEYTAGRDGQYICHCTCGRWDVVDEDSDTGLELARRHTGEITERESVELNAS